MLASTRLLAAAMASSSSRAPRLMRVAAIHATRMQAIDDNNFGFDAAPRPPSEKQVMYAQRLAQQLALELPPLALTDGIECSSFIDRALSQVPPSQRQLEFARTIAQSANIELPEHSLHSSKSVSEYIEANKHLAQGAPGSFSSGTDAGNSQREPSEKQIIFAAKLARQLNTGLAAEVLQSRSAMSGFIEESQRLLKERNGVYGSGMGGGGRYGGGGGFPAPFAAGGGSTGASGLAGAPMSGAAGAFAAADVPFAGLDAEAPAARFDAPGGGTVALDEDPMFSNAAGEEEDPAHLLKEGSIPF